MIIQKYPQAADEDRVKHNVAESVINIAVETHNRKGLDSPVALSRFIEKVLAVGKENIEKLDYEYLTIDWNEARSTVFASAMAQRKYLKDWLLQHNVIVLDVDWNSGARQILQQFPELTGSGEESKFSTVIKKSMIEDKRKLSEDIARSLLNTRIDIWVEENLSRLTFRLGNIYSDLQKKPLGKVDENDMIQYNLYLSHILAHDGFMVVPHRVVLEKLCQILLMSTWGFLLIWKKRRGKLQKNILTC